MGPGGKGEGRREARAHHMSMNVYLLNIPIDIVALCIVALPFAHKLRRREKLAHGAHDHALTRVPRGDVDSDQYELVG